MMPIPKHTATETRTVATGKEIRVRDTEYFTAVSSSNSTGVIKINRLSRRQRLSAHDNSQCRSHFIFMKLSLIVIKEQAIRKGNSEAWRYLLPFFLLVSVCLLSLFRFLGPTATPTPLVCAGNSVRYLVQPGDSCWAIANGHGVSVADLVRLNQGMECSLLKAGSEICVPLSE
jgi:LysM repeat protein